MEEKPYRVSVDTDSEIIFLGITGSVDADMLNEAADAVTEAPGWKNYYDCLCDFRSANEVDVTPEGLEELVHKAIQRREGLQLQGKIAVLVHRWTLSLVGQLAEFRLKSEQREFRVFKDEKEALRWLGLPESMDVQEKVEAKQ